MGAEAKAVKTTASAIFDDGEVQEVLREQFYAREPKGPAKARPPKPDHYEVICISLYREDLERLDEMVGALKARGLRKMNRSALIRYALDQVKTDKVPRGY